VSKLNTYLLFDGTCAEALARYAEIFATEAEMTRVAESPMAGQFPAESGYRIIHGRLAFDGNTLMASDWMASLPYPGIHGFFLMLTCADTVEAARVFAALAEGGRIQAPLAKMPFATAYGTLTDRFGVAWQVKVD